MTDAAMAAASAADVPASAGNVITITKQPAKHVGMPSATVFDVSGSSAGITGIKTSERAPNDHTELLACAKFTFVNAEKAEEAEELLINAGIKPDWRVPNRPIVIALKYPGQIKTAMEVMGFNLNQGQIEELLNSSHTLRKESEKGWSTSRSGGIGLDGDPESVGGYDFLRYEGDNKILWSNEITFNKAPSVFRDAVEELIVPKPIAAPDPFVQAVVDLIDLDATSKINLHLLKEGAGSGSLRFKTPEGMIKALLIAGCSDEQIKVAYKGLETAKNILREYVESGANTTNTVEAEGISLTQKNCWSALKLAAQGAAQETLAKVGNGQEEGQAPSSRS